jgi:RF-1 domain
MTPSSHPASLPEDVLLKDCVIRRTRRSGPGGQHRNKVESAIVITHVPTGIIGQASERRSQHENHRVAIARLRLALAIGYRNAYEQSATKANSGLWSQWTAGGKLAVSANHRDYPALLAEFLDRLAANDFEVSAIAAGCGCSASQLVRFLAREPLAIEHVNNERKRRGKRPYQPGK